MENQNNIRIIFSNKAYSALDEIIKNFNLAETIEDDIKKSKDGKPANVVIITGLAKDFVRGNISEKDIINSLKTEVAVPQQKAEQILKEIITKIVPFLEKFSEDLLINSNQTLDKSKTDFRATLENIKNETDKNDADIFPKIEQPININEKIEKNPAPKKIVRIKKQNKGPDNYREPIE